MRRDGRAGEQLRPITITRRFTQTPAGSVLWQQGQTLVLCTVSITAELPPWFKEDRPGGWVTAEYLMHPASTPQRKPWPKIGHTDSRGTEIQRLIGRCLRAVIDLSRLGPHTLAVDCQVLQADGGTRTACICAAYVALRDALAKLPPELPVPRGKATADRNGLVLARYDPAFYQPAAALVDQVAAVSVAVVDGELRLDPDYLEDSAAEVDLNVAATAAGRLVEVQGSAESGRGFDRDQLNRMIDLALLGCANIMDQQRRCLLS